MLAIPDRCREFLRGKWATVVGSQQCQIAAEKGGHSTPPRVSGLLNPRGHYGEERSDAAIVKTLQYPVSDDERVTNRSGYPVQVIRNEDQTAECGG